MRSSALPRRSALCLAVCWIALTLGACRQDSNGGGRRGQAGGNDSDLPAPQASGGSVTGMPDAPGPGQGNAPVEGMLPPQTPIAGDGSSGAAPIDAGSLPGDAAQAFPDVGESVPDEMPLPPSPTDEPSAQDAVGVVREYYSAINARQYARAYSLWSDGGRSSGQDPQQFADSLADTDGVSVQIDTPGRIDAAAGSRYIEVPVSVSTTRRDGSVQRFVGIFTLRRAVVDGASPEERMWQINSADIREVRP